MFTKREHVKILSKNVISRLEQDEAIVLNARMRQNVYQDLYQKIASYIYTDEDIRQKVIEKLGKNAEALGETDAAESDQYKAAKSVIMAQLGENAVEGLYYQQPLKNIAQAIGQFVMSHTFVEDVFLSDEDLEKTVVDFLKKFKPDQLH